MSSSKSYVIAEYRDVTRKLQGDWCTDTYSNLIEAIRLKFKISDETEIEIKVYDKTNKKYFLIDEDEMVEVPRGGLIKITISNKKKSKKKALIPPKLSKKEEKEFRNKWRVNSKVELYSDSNKKWIGGKIFAIINDNEGEWLRIGYLNNREKEIQRFSKFIRPIIPLNYKSKLKTETPITLCTTNVKEEQEEKEKEVKIPFNISAQPFVPIAITTSPNVNVNVKKEEEEKSPDLPPLPVQKQEKAASVTSETIVKKIEEVVNFVEEAKNEKKEVEKEEKKEEKEEKEKPVVQKSNKKATINSNDKTNGIKNLKQRKYDWKSKNNYKQSQFQKGQYRMVTAMGYGKKGQPIERIVSYNQYRKKNNYKKRRNYNNKNNNNKRRQSYSYSSYYDYDYDTPYYSSYYNYYERYPPPPPDPYAYNDINYAVNNINGQNKIVEKVCWQYNTMIGCPRGEKCQWKHEYVASAGKNAFLTSKCWQFHTFTGCPRGVYCPWNHY